MWGGGGPCGVGSQAACSPACPALGAGDPNPNPNPNPNANPRRPSSASAASPRRNANGPRYSRGSEPPRRPQSAHSRVPSSYQDGLGPSLEHVRELEAQGPFTDS